MFAVSLGVLFLSRLFPARSAPAGLTVSVRVRESSFLALDSIDTPLEAFGEGLLSLRPARRLRPGFCSLLAGLAEPNAVVMSDVFSELMRLDDAGFGCFVSGLVRVAGFTALIFVAIREVAAILVRFVERVAGVVFVDEDRLPDERIGVVRREVLAGLMCLRLDEAGVGCFWVSLTGAEGFAALILVAMLDGPAVFMRFVKLMAGLVLPGKDGPAAGRTGAVIREVFSGLMRVVGVGAGFAGFGEVNATGGLDIPRACATLGGGVVAFGGVERGAELIGPGLLGLAAIGGRLPRLGRNDALGAR
ncbi:MAG TPA: hypothetical protein HPP87_02395 [Planctomycetes bacterium]|nr:hypothetical protein [Planctomycetota bacterium]HIJ70197.1 hypothetical protein [Planctomycetota bacterium]